MKCENKLIKPSWGRSRKQRRAVWMHQGQPNWSLQRGVDGAVDGALPLQDVLDTLDRNQEVLRSMQSKQPQCLETLRSASAFLSAAARDAASEEAMFPADYSDVDTTPLQAEATVPT